jgi:hypothetical protein
MKSRNIQIKHAFIFTFEDQILYSLVHVTPIFIYAATFTAYILGENVPLERIAFDVIPLAGILLFIDNDFNDLNNFYLFIFRVLHFIYVVICIHSYG